MYIQHNGTQPSAAGLADYFTGTVRIDPLFPANALARTAWHTHPLGQTLIVAAGCGRIQLWGEPIQEIKSGDVIWIPAGEKHWHGAAPTTALTHIAIQEEMDGSTVTWLEHVSNEQYSNQ